MQQKRLILALLISTVILFGWGYLFPVKSPQPGKPTSASPSPQPGGSTEPKASAELLPQGTPVNVQTTPRQTIVIKTPFYEATLDSRGGVVVSWILKKNKANNRPLYSVAGSKTSGVPLELISQDGLRRQPREAPLQLITGDYAID